jgi:hypothetical protein
MDGWGYYADSASPILSGFTAHEEISSAGFGGSNTANFPGETGITLDGYAWGIVGSGYTAGNKIDGDANGAPVLQTSGTFTLSGMGSLTAADVKNVTFLWGTLPDASGSGAPSVTPPVPEPSRVVALCSLCGIGLVGLVLRRKSQAA